MKIHIQCIIGTNDEANGKLLAACPCPDHFFPDLPGIKASELERHILTSPALRVDAVNDSADHYFETF